MDGLNRGEYPNLPTSQLIDELRELGQRITQLEAHEAERTQVIQSLRESEEKYRILLDESSDPIFTFHPDGQYRYVNKAFADGVGKKQSDIIGKKIWDVFPQDEADMRYAAVKWVFEHGETKVIDVRVPRPDGDRYYITTVKPILGEHGHVTTVICISKEITERKRIEKELEYLSTHDTLTGLYNRNFFEAELTRIQHSRQFPISIVVIDMDNLKIVNDRYGHSAGDDLIRRVAEYLRQTCRAEDIVARIGGDEFVVLLSNTSDFALLTLVNRLSDAFANQPDKRLKVSIGFATGNEGSSLVDVMRVADDRMYQEKSTRKKTSGSNT